VFFGPVGGGAWVRSHNLDGIRMGPIQPTGQVPVADRRSLPGTILGQALAIIAETSGIPWGVLLHRAAAGTEM